ncbi:GntR family transcriptional regulator [Ochrobactrum soli]|uniref:GntR family transcriptional regulator n=1 Tax=Ochrobactrum soli TaxID=2448455 RepID=A0A849KKY7_9HYPH|nr:GntR family transcriptional regulator [[Ochrobactrum] soli]NNU61043.1 GntR family transcriptional regulator [[Ochrobactrum] soli]
MSNNFTPSDEQNDPQGRTGDMVQILATSLRGKILSGELPAGQRVRESSIASDLNVSRATLREALRLIERGGLIEKSPNRSYIVVSFNERDIFELATLRTALEVMGARLALQRSYTSSALAAAIPAIASAAENRDLKSLAAADRRFHEILIECADHRRLLESYHALQDQIELAMLNVQKHELNIAGIADRHARLVALATNPDKFVEELYRHIREGMGVSDISVLI